MRQPSPAKDPKAAILRSLSGTTNGTTRVRSFKGFTHGTFYLGLLSVFDSEFSLFCCRFFLEFRKLDPIISLITSTINVLFVVNKEFI